MKESECGVDVVTTRVDVELSDTTWRGWYNMLSPPRLELNWMILAVLEGLQYAGGWCSMLSPQGLMLN